MTTLRHAGKYRGPAPVVHPETEPHWHGLGHGELLLQQCDECGTVRFPLAPVCWKCLAIGHDWVPVPTTGAVSAAVTVVRATGDQLWADEVPFVTALVDMDCGQRLPGRVVCEPGTHVSRGTPVEAAYLSVEDGTGVLCFVPLKETR